MGKTMTPQQKQIWLFWTHLPEEGKQKLNLEQLKQLAAKRFPRRGQRWDQQTLQKMLHTLNQKEKEAIK